jgi:hypothetical protein
MGFARVPATAGAVRRQGASELSQIGAYGSAFLYASVATRVASAPVLFRRLPLRRTSVVAQFPHALRVTSPLSTRVDRELALLARLNDWQVPTLQRVRAPSAASTSAATCSGAPSSSVTGPLARPPRRPRHRPRTLPCERCGCTRTRSAGKPTPTFCRHSRKPARNRKTPAMVARARTRRSLRIRGHAGSRKSAARRSRTSSSSALRRWVLRLRRRPQPSEWGAPRNLR